jgi:DNA-binding NarL/FixJ family response regulator
MRRATPASRNWAAPFDRPDPQQAGHHDDGGFLMDEITLVEASKLIGKSRSYLWLLVARGWLPAHKKPGILGRGQIWWVSRADVEARAWEGRMVRGNPNRLTERGRQVLSLLARGYTSRQIAQKLVVSEGAVAQIVGRTKNKLRAETAAHAVAIAISRGMLE